MTLFKPAVKHESKLRLAIAGPSGSGKTYSALAIGTALGKTAVVDTEHGSAASPGQFRKDAKVAQANGLVEFVFDVDGGYYIATEKFNKLDTQFS